MRKIMLIAILCCFANIGVFSQKKTINGEASSDWMNLRDYKISNNGKYAWFSWSSQKQWGVTLISTDRGYKKEFLRATSGAFASNNRTVLISTGDTLCVYNIGRTSPIFLKGVSDYKLIGGNNSKLLYSTREKLIVRDLENGETFSFPAAKEYAVAPDEKTMVMTNSRGGVQLIDLTTFRVKNITSAPEISHLTYNTKANGVAFVSKNIDGQNSIYYYGFKMMQAELVVKNSNLATKDLYVENSSLEFSPDGEHLYFKVLPIRPVPIKDNERISNGVSIWNYKDKILKGEYYLSADEDHRRQFLAVISLRSHSILQLEDDSTIMVQGGYAYNNHYALVRNLVNVRNAYWDKTQSPLFKLVDLDNGSRMSFVPKSHKLNAQWTVPSFSPNGKYLTWKDANSGDVFCYEIASGYIRNCTQTISQDLKDKSNFQTGNLGLIGWTPGDLSLFVGDAWGMWLVDPAGKIKSVDLTGDYCRKKKILVEMEGFDQLMNSSILTVRLLDSNNNNGFGSINLKRPGTVKMGKLSPCLYSWPMNSGPPPIMKAKDANAFLVTRQTASDAPNLFFTSDFIDYQALSDFQPQKKYNWMTSELVRWRMYDGRLAKGILYKPENFDPSKKYPVIFNYYQERNSELHYFRNILYPSDWSTNINIAEYVSNGYLVFIPDIINIIPTQRARDVVNSVESAAKWIKHTKMTPSDQIKKVPFAS